MWKSFLDRGGRPLLLCLSLSLPWGSVARADDFQARYTQAVAAYKKGSYAEAITHFQRAYDLRPLPRLLINIGRAHLKLGHPDQALAFLRLYLQTDREAPPALRAEVEQEIAQAEAQVARAQREAPQAPRETPPVRREAAPPPAQIKEEGEDGLQVLLDRGENLFHRERYPEAMQAWEAAYAIRPLPWLLYRLGQVHQRLGQAEAALAYYLRYLDEAAEQDPRTTADVRAQVRQLRQVRASAPLSAPEAAVAQPAVAKPAAPLSLTIPAAPRRRTGVLWGGIALWTAAYLPAAITGIAYGAAYDPRYNALVLGARVHDSALDGAFYSLLIPVGGPFLSAILYPLATHNAGQAMAWSLTWSLLDGAAQIAGLAMTVAGARRTAPARLTLAPLAHPGGSGVALSGAF